MVETLSLAIDAGRVKKGADDFERSGRRIDASGRRIDASVNRTERRVRKLGAASSTAAGLMGRLFTAAAAGAGARAGIRTFAQYEQSIATIRGVLGGQIEDQSRLDQSMQKIEQTSRQLGATTRFSAAEAADGVLFLTRAGFSAEQSIAAIPATLDLAQVGMLELGEAADYASNIVTGFGLAANETERVVDVMVNTSNRANTDVRQLAEAMKFVAPIAGALGISVEETSAAIGVLGNSGIQASMAGTNLRGVLIKLLSPTGDAKEAMQNLHLEMSDLDPSVNGLIDAFERLAERNLGAKEATDLFMARNTAAGLVLTQNVETVKDLTAANDAANGSARKFAETMDDTLIGSFKSMLSATQELTLQVGEGGVGGALRTTVDTMTAALRILAGMEASVTENRKAAFLLAAALKGVGTAAAIIVGLKLATLASSVLGSLYAMPGSIAAISAALVPLAATLAGVATAALSFELGRYFFDEFKSVQITVAKMIAFLDQTWAGVKSGFTVLMANLIKIFEEDFGVAIFDAARHIVRGVASIVDLVVPQFSEGLDAMMTAARQGLISNTGFADKMLSDAAESYANDVAFATSVLETTIGAINDNFGDDSRRGQNFSDFIKGDLATAEREISEFIDRLAASAEAAFTSAGSGEGIMGPFAPDGLLETRDAAKNLEGIINSLSEETGDLDDTTRSASDGYAEWVTQINEARTALQIELALLQEMSDVERVRLQAKERGLDLTQQQIDTIAQMEADLVVLDQQREKVQEIRDLYEELGDEIANTFADVVFGSKSAEEALEGMVKNITRMIFDMLVTQQIAGLIAGSLGGLFGFGGGSGSGSSFNPNLPGGSVGPGNALGGTHDGPIHPFASGGILGPSPTIMQTGSGDRLLAREAGPEAIVPLARDAQGRLGVRQSGGGGQNVTVNMRVETRDARSFQSRESQAQIQRRLRRAIDGSTNLPGG